MKIDFKRKIEVELISIGDIQIVDNEIIGKARIKIKKKGNSEELNMNIGDKVEVFVKDELEI
jgi:hypothetical protein